MVAIEREYCSLLGVLPKDDNSLSLDKQRLGELIELIRSIALGDDASRSKNILEQLITVNGVQVQIDPAGPICGPYRLGILSGCRAISKVADSTLFWL
jgi:hypothetical protein